MEKSTYFLVTLLSLAMGAVGADESVYDDEMTASFEEVAALKKQKRGLDVVSGDTHRITTLEQQMNEVYTSTARDTFGAKAASARPQLDSYRLYISADFLYWKTFEGGKDYASQTNRTIIPMEGSSKSVDFEWACGFRTEFGYRTAHDDWDLAAHYTWFFDKGESEADAPTSGGVTPLFYTPEESYALYAKSHADVHFQEGDLALQKSYFLSPNFSLTWIAALRSSWINQNVKAESYAPRQGLGRPTRWIEQSGKNDFWGIGPKIGFSPKWFIDKNWHFFGSFAGSLLYGEYDVRIRNEDNGVVPPKAFKADLHQIAPTAQGALGVSWETNSFCDHYHIALNVAYEAQYWWRQNQLLSYLPNGEPTIVLRRLSEDLGFHGLTINALFDF